MKTIVLGYKDVAANGPSQTLKGTEVSIKDQMLFVTGIKSNKKYPEGIARVDFAEVVVRSTCVSIEASVKAREADASARAKRDKLKDKVAITAEKTAAEAEEKSAAHKEAAAKVIRDAAKAEKDATREAMTSKK